MQATESPTLTNRVTSDRQLHRLVEIHAAAEASAALKAAAARAREGAGADAALLADAEAVAAASRGIPAGDTTYDRLGAAISSREFLALLPSWVKELRALASSKPDSGACTVATALELWAWTAKHVTAGGAAGAALDQLSDAIAPLLAARALALDLTGDDELRRDLCHVHAARASALAGAACAELVFGRRRHLVWDAEGCASCYSSDQLDEIEAMVPGAASGARMTGEVVEADGSHAAKEGPCARFDGLEGFMRLRNRLDGCLTGAGLAKQRAVAAFAAGCSTSMTTEGKA